MERHVEGRFIKYTPLKSIAGYIFESTWLYKRVDAQEYYPVGFV